MASWSWGTCRQLPWWVGRRPSMQRTGGPAVGRDSHRGGLDSLLQRHTGSMRRLPLQLRGWVLRDVLASREGPGGC